MDENKFQRAYIFYRAKLGISASEIHAELVQVNGDSALSYPTVARWKTLFDNGKTSIEDEMRPGRPLIDGLCDPILRLVIENPHISTREISIFIGIPKTTVLSRLATLGWRNMHTKWVPHNLTDSQKNERVRLAKIILSELKKASKEKLIITGDETWVYFDNPPCAKWVEPGGSPTKRQKRVLTNRKCMLVAFFSRVGIEYTTFVPEGETMTADYFCQYCLKPMKEKITKRRPMSGIRDVKFHFDNARIHTAKKTKSFLETEGFVVVPHPPYSPDISPCDFFLFGYLKGKLQGTYAHDRTEIMRKSEKILEEIPKEMFQQVTDEWKRRLDLCIKVNGEYVE